MSNLRQLLCRGKTDLAGRCGGGGSGECAYIIEASHFTSTADGTDSFTPLSRDGNSMIGYVMVQLIKEIKPLFNDEYSFDEVTGEVTLLLGQTLDEGQTIFYTYIRPL